MMKNAILIPLLSIATAVSSPASVLVSFSGSSEVNTTVNAPTQNVFASTENTLVNSGFSWRSNEATSPNTRNIAQSFFVSEAVTFDKFTLKTAGANVSGTLVDNAEIKFTLAIYEVSTGTSVLTGGETPLSSQEGSFAGFGKDRTVTSGNIAGSAYNYVTFDFANVQLAANKYYMVVLSTGANEQGFNIALGTNGNNSTTYTQGTGAYANDGGSWATSSDFYFYAQAVPEPGTVGAVMLGGLMLAMVRRRGKPNNQ